MHGNSSNIAYTQGVASQPYRIIFTQVKEELAKGEIRFDFRLHKTLLDGCTEQPVFAWQDGFFLKPIYCVLIPVDITSNTLLTVESKLNTGAGSNLENEDSSPAAGWNA